MPGSQKDTILADRPKTYHFGFAVGRVADPKSALWIHIALYMEAKKIENPSFFLVSSGLYPIPKSDIFHFSVSGRENRCFPGTLAFGTPNRV